MDCEDEAFDRTVRLGSLFLPNARLLGADRLQCPTCGLVGALLHGIKEGQAVVLITQFDAVDEKYRDSGPWICSRCGSQDVIVRRAQA